MFQYSPRSLWNQVLWRGTNKTGYVSRDPLAEKFIIQVFNENIKTSLVKGEKILGWQLDPVWLWPQEPLELRRGHLLRGKLKACNLHLHNVKTVQLVDIEGKPKFIYKLAGVKSFNHIANNVTFNFTHFFAVCKTNSYFRP